MEQPRNKDQKCAVVLLLDTSGSMAGEPINELNKALVSFKEEILSDPTLSQRLEVGVVCFDDEARIEKPIDLMSPESDMPYLEIGGYTNLVAGMDLAIELIEERKNFYKSNQEPYYRPFIVLFTDGAPTNTYEEIDELDRRIQAMSDSKKFVFMPFGVEGADFELLAKLAAQTPDQRLKKIAVSYKLMDVKKFSEIFAFVSASIGAAIGQGGASTTVQLDPTLAQAITFDLDN
jgi:uncharacterized protein YegL